MLEKVYERVELPFPDKKIEIFTDGNTDYEYYENATPDW